MRIQKNNIIRKFIVAGLVTLAVKHTPASDECRIVFDSKGIKSPFFINVTIHSNKNQAIEEIHKMIPDKNAQDYEMIAYIQNIPPSNTMTKFESQPTHQEAHDYLLNWTSKQHAISFINKHVLNQNQQIYLQVVRKESSDITSKENPSPENVIQKLEKLSLNLENALKNVKDKKNFFQNTLMAIKKNYWTVQIAQNTRPNLKKNIRRMENAMKQELTPGELQSILQKELTSAELQNIVQKELTPTEYNIITARLQNKGQNSNTIPIFYIPMDTVEKRVIHFNESIGDINRLRSNVTEATKTAISKEVIFKDAIIKAKDIWPSLQILTQAIDKAFKEHNITSTELEEVIQTRDLSSKDQPQNPEETAPLQAKTVHEKKDDELSPPNNVLRFPSKIERLNR